MTSKLLHAAAAAAITAGLTLGTGSAFGKELYFGMAGEVSTLDPHIHTGTFFRNVKLAVHRGLVNYGTDGEISAELAESYELSPDAKTLTFHLRDARFHDGSTVTANDVKATFDRIMAPNSTASFRAYFALIDSIEIPDDKTVVLHFKRPSVTFIHYLALPESSILPAAWIEQHGTDASAEPPIGAGPFKFVNWSRGRELVIEKFEDYYKEGKPYLDRVTYQFFVDENTRVNAFRAGDVDLIEYLPAREMEAFEADPNVRVETTFGPYMGLQFNVDSGLLANPDVRKAIAHAIDRSIIVNTSFDGVGAPIYGLAVPEGYLGYDAEKANYYRVDLDHAKELMARAGYPDGFETRLLATSQYSFHQNTAVVIQSELAKIGIKVSLDLPDWTTRTTRSAAGDYQMLLVGTIGEITDPDWLASHYYAGPANLQRAGKPANFRDEEVDRLIEQGSATVDVEERKAIYAQLTDRVLDLTPFIFLTWRDHSYAVRENVKGFKALPGFLAFQSALTLEETQVD